MMGQITVTGNLLGNLSLEIERKFDISLYGSGGAYLAGQVSRLPACIMDIN